MQKTQLNLNSIGCLSLTITKQQLGISFGYYSVVTQKRALTRELQVETLLIPDGSELESTLTLMMKVS